MRTRFLAIKSTVVLLSLCTCVAHAADTPAPSEPAVPAAEQASAPSPTPAQTPAQAPLQPQSGINTASPGAETAPEAAPSSAKEPKPPATPVPTQMPEAAPKNDQVIEPQVDRRTIKVPHIPSNNFEIGIFGGAYDTEYFGTNAVYGARLGYDITEDFFVQAAYGQTKVSDATYRLILPGGIFPVPEEILRYYDLSVGYNILPGEFFFGRNYAKVSALYLIAGLGTTKINGSNRETVNFGFGTRVFLTNWMALQLDVRDYVFSLDILGEQKNFQNFELTGGLTFFF